MRHFCRIQLLARHACRIEPVMQYEAALLAISRLYSEQVRIRSGRSLARVATVVANRGSFFDALESGATCSVRNLDKFISYFANPGHWPDNTIPEKANAVLAAIGRTSIPAPAEA